MLVSVTRHIIFVSVQCVHSTSALTLSTLTMGPNTARCRPKTVSPVVLRRFQSAWQSTWERRTPSATTTDQMSTAFGNGTTAALAMNYGAQVGTPNSNNAYR